MFGFTRTKRVTDPLDDKVKARIIGKDHVEPNYSSSRREHSAEVDDGVTSSSLSELVFFGFCDVHLTTNEIVESSPERDATSSIGDSIGRNVDSISIEPTIVAVDFGDAFRNILEDHVSNAVSLFSGAKSDERIVRRSVMAYLRNIGYNAAVCKTKWESSGGLTAGSHEFIDVVSDDGAGTRYFVDLKFASEFEIARPTSSYERFLRCVPEIFVGKSVDLKRILKAVSDGTRRSLRSGGLHLPPWRKYWFMQNKWLGSYRRTSNLLPESVSYGPVECRAVGFDPAVVGGRLVLPAATRGDDFVFK